jgi:hypothetical protein
VTFAIVAIVGALALILGTRMVLKRYRNSREAREVDEWSEKYSTGHDSSNWHGDGQYARDDDPYVTGNSIATMVNTLAAASTTAVNMAEAPEGALRTSSPPPPRMP